MIQKINSYEKVKGHAMRHRYVILTYAFCLFGLLWQMSQVSQEYFTYEMVSNVEYTKDDNVDDPPAFSLCFPYYELTDFRGNRNHHDPHDHHQDQMVAKSIQENMTIGQLLQVTPSLQEITSSIWIQRKESFWIDRNFESIDVKKFIKDYNVCYRIQHTDYTPSSSDGGGASGGGRPKNHLFRSHHVTFGSKPGALMGVAFERETLKDLTRSTLYLHSGNTLPRGDYDFPLTISGNVGGGDHFSYKKIFRDMKSRFWALAYGEETLQLLPPPFPTGCRDYSQVGFESEAHCQYQCVSRKSLRVYGKSMFAVAFDRPENFSVISKYSLIQDKFLQRHMDRFVDECSDQCSAFNCVRQIFVPSLVESRSTERLVIFQLRDMNGLEVRGVYYPKIPSVEFFTQILSISGVWLGLSCADIMTCAFQMVEEVSVRVVLFLIELLIT